MSEKWILRNTLWNKQLHFFPLKFFLKTLENSFYRNSRWLPISFPSLSKEFTKSNICWSTCRSNFESLTRSMCTASNTGNGVVLINCKFDVVILGVVQRLLTAKLVSEFSWFNGDWAPRLISSFVLLPLWASWLKGHQATLLGLLILRPLRVVWLNGH